MKNKNKFLGICGILAGAGIVLSAIGFGMGGVVTGITLGSNGLQVHTLNGTDGDKKQLEEGKEKLETFKSMDVTLDYAEFKVVVSDHYGIEYKVDKEYGIRFEVKDGCLEVVQGNKKDKSQFNFINFGFNSWNTAFDKQSVIIYVPENTDLKELSVISDSGNVTAGGFNAENLTVKADYGNVDIREMESIDMDLTLDSGNLEMQDIKTETIGIVNDYGNCNFENVSVKTAAKMELDSGNLTMENTDIKKLDAIAEYGNIEGKELKADEMILTLESGNLKMDDTKIKLLNVSAEYGDITGKEMQIDEMALALDSGNCKLNELTTNKVDIKSEYGSVELKVTDSTALYGMELFTDYGDIMLDNGKIGATYNRSEGQEAGKYIKVNCDSGNIEIVGNIK